MIAFGKEKRVQKSNGNRLKPHYIVNYDTSCLFKDFFSTCRFIQILVLLTINIFIDFQSKNAISARKSE